MNKFAILLIILITAIAFLPSLSNDFVNWDDPIYVTHNDAIKGFSYWHIHKIFTSPFQSTYLPLTMLTYSLEYKFFGLNPLAYHMTNFLLNILITVSVFYFIFLISRSVKVAFVAGVLFGIHPLHVESVAWISERKDLMCALFYVLALVAYLVYLKARKRLPYFLCFIAFIFSLLSKPMAVTLPLIFILLDFFYRRKLDLRAVLEKVPFFVFSFIFGIVNMRFQSLRQPGDLLERIYFSSKAFLFYLNKIFLPVKLSSLYLYHDVAQHHFNQLWLYLPIIFCIAIIVIFSLKWGRKVFFGSAFFVIVLLPVLQIVPIGETFVADRYAYLPSIGIFYLCGILTNGVLNGLAARNKIVKTGVYSLVSVLVVILSILTWNRCTVWKNSITLFEDAALRSPNTPLIHNNLGIAYMKAGDHKKAMASFKRVIEINPRHMSAYGNLGILYRKLGRYDEAISAYKKALTLVPTNPVTLNGLGLAHRNAGHINEAAYCFIESIKYVPVHAPTYSRAYNNLALLYMTVNRKEHALQLFNKAIAVNPNFIDPYYNLTIFYFHEKKYDLAIKYYDQAIARGGKHDPQLSQMLAPYRNKPPPH